VTLTYIILQVADNKADSVKLLAPEGKKNEKSVSLEGESCIRDKIVPTY
jgi:hypothetical protein